MSGARASYLAGRREVRERLRSKAFRISILIQVLAVLAIAVIASATSGDGNSTTTVKVGVIGESGKAVAGQAAGFSRDLDLEFEQVKFRSLSEARTALDDGDIEAAVGDSPVLVSSDIPEPAQAVLAQAASDSRLRQKLDESSLPAGQGKQIVDASKVPYEVVAPEGEEDSGQGIAFIGTLLLYLALIFCGYAVSSGVIEEKSTRVVELIINAIKPRHLLAGKVMGIGLMGLLQLVLVVGAGLGVALAMGEIDLPEGTAETVALAFVYFVLGFGLYGCAFAVAGSIVSRQEDSQSTTAPVMILLVASYLLSISAINDPSSSLAVAGTLIPPMAPLIVPARAAAGELPVEQLVLSIVLMVAACLALIWLAGRVYERAVLRMGAPIKARELIRLVRSD